MVSCYLGLGFPLSPRFGHPPVPSRDAQIPNVLVIPCKKMLDFAGKSKTCQRWLPLNIEIFSCILKRRLIRKALQSKKTTLQKFAKKFEYDSKLESLFYVAKEKDGTALRRLVITEEEKARVFEECDSVPFSGHAGRDNTFAPCSVLKPDVWVNRKFMYWTSHNTMRARLRVLEDQRSVLNLCSVFVVIL